uniref:Uncharacterized protein n=1 Tax=Anguilla anguilla TaxID=7936 RepID=A0A0E9SX41_ANGAN
MLPPTVCCEQFGE